MNTSHEPKAGGHAAAQGAAAVRIEMLGRFAVLRGEDEVPARIGHAELSAAALRGLGIARQAAGDLAGAQAAFERPRRAAGNNALFAGWAAARLALVRIRQGRLVEADALTASALEHGAPLARHEARWARAELDRACGDGAAPHTATAALAAARASGYLALFPG